MINIVSFGRLGILLALNWRYDSHVGNCVWGVESKKCFKRSNLGEIAVSLRRRVKELKRMKRQKLKVAKK